MKRFLSTQFLFSLLRENRRDGNNHGSAYYFFSAFSGTGLLIALLFLLGTNAVAKDKILDVATSGQDSLVLASYFSVLEDASGMLTLADVQRPDIANRFAYHGKATDAFEFGFTQSAYWLRLSLINTSSQPVKRMLEIDYALLTQLQYFHVANGKVLEQGVTGIDEVFSSRPFPSRHFVFPVMLPAQGEQVFFLRVKAIDSMVIPARLWSPQAYKNNERSDYVAQAIYLGMASAMILFNLLLFIGGLRDKIYLLYVAYASSLLLSVLGLTGLGKQYVWPNLTWMSNVILVAAFALALAALLLFMRRMVGTASLIPRLDRLYPICRHHLFCCGYRHTMH
jgi:two-component system, sensor histidine kinase LadS